MPHEDIDLVHAAAQGVGIQRLLGDWIIAHGVSYDDVANAAAISKATVARLLASPPPYLIRDQTIHALAEGLEVPLGEVQRAALESAGYVHITDEDLIVPADQRPLVQAIVDLNDDQREVLAALIEVLRQRRNTRTTTAR
jgi:transcriptional regulator with XRE-family HTH domain